jgi:hypothetical protein
MHRCVIEYRLTSSDQVERREAFQGLQHSTGWGGVLDEKIICLDAGVGQQLQVLFYNRNGN